MFKSTNLSHLFITLLFSFLILSSAGVNKINAQDEDGFTIGGAVRYNLMLTDYEDEITANDGQFTWDTWRINVAGQSGGILLNFEYRFYPTFNTHFIHHGWFGYNFSDNTQIQLGVNQVPFGNLKYASHSWWFVTNYYVGLEDDYDMGLKLLHTTGNWDLAFAYYFQPEPAGPAYGTASFGNASGPGRYSYDIIPITGGKPWDYVLGENEVPQSNQERHQFNARVAYDIPHDEDAVSEIGVSAQYGGIYNRVTDESSPSYALSGHLDGTYGNFNIKAQYLYYNYDITNDIGDEVNHMYMAAYGDPYAVATEASMTTLGIAYTLDVELGPISSLTFYDDYTYTDKAYEEYFATQQNTLGFLVAAGPVYTYFDIAMGKNQPWLTNNFGTGLAQGVEDAEWNIRYNINMGYYF